MSQYKSINRLDISAEGLEVWASARETDAVVAHAIHAIADKNRDAAEIWECPTSAEFDHVRMAIENYVDAGDYEPQPSYRWGEESISITDQ